MRKSITSVLLTLAAVPGLAQAAEPPCLSAGEFASLAGYTMPSIISGTTQRCAPNLSPGAFLRTGGDELSARYARRKASEWQGAKAAFLKLSASSPDTARIFQSMSDESLQKVVDAMVEGMVSQQIPLERCTAIDRIVRLLAPLPPENTAELIAIAVGLGSKSGGGKLGKIGLCPA